MRKIGETAAGAFLVEMLPEEWERMALEPGPARLAALCESGWDELAFKALRRLVREGRLSARRATALGVHIDPASATGRWRNLSVSELKALLQAPNTSGRPCGTNPLLNLPGIGLKGLDEIRAAFQIAPPGRPRRRMTRTRRGHAAGKWKKHASG